MKLSAEQLQQLHHLLAAEYACAGSLLEILQQEHQVLKTGNADELLQISKSKQLAVAQMHKCAIEREKLHSRLQKLGHQRGFASIIEAHPESSAASAWRQLEKISHQLHEQNEINGGIVALSQQHNRQALDILSGRTEKNSTYSARGQYRPSGAGRALAKA